MNAKTVVVTGAIRGIGFEIARQLAGHSAQVILTARKSEAGQAAINKLNGVRSVPHFHPLDVTNEESIEKLAAFISATYGELDVLVNNAGIIPDSDTEVLSIDLSTIRTTLETNTLAPLRLAQVLAALLRKSGTGRVINISSGMGALSEMRPDHASYRMSKAALNAVTGMLAAEFRGSDIAVNSVCPGWVRTDLGGANAERDVSEGADTAVWLALDAPQSLTGKFVRDRQVIP